jgi:hypothetical protein
MTRARALILLAVTSLTALIAGCSAFVPEYRVEVLDVPTGTVRLQVATYVNGALTSDSPTVDVQGPRDRFMFAINLTGMLQGADAVISVAAVNASSCLLAVGTSGSVHASDSGTDVSLALVKPNPELAAGECRTPSLTILALIRTLQGPLKDLDNHFSLQVQGWGFQPTADVTVRSAYPVNCSGDAACIARCPNTTPGGLRTSCALTADVVHAGPALLELRFDAKKNQLRTVDSVYGFIQLVDRTPLTVTVTNPGTPAASTSFSETPIAITTT